MLEKVFLDVLELSETGTLVILAVLLLRCLLHRVPKKFSYVLWSIPAIRLSVPVSFHGIFRLPEGGAGAGTAAVLPPVTDAADALLDFGGQAMTAAAKSGSLQVPAKPSLLLVLACVWLAGIAFLAAKDGYDYYRLRRKLRVCVECGRHVYLADEITQPFVLAGFPGGIYLPSGLDEEERRYILLHEQVHVGRGDAFFALFASAIRCIHWFNPMVWLGVYYFGRDMEMSCDEAAAAGLSAAEKRAYAMELLRFSTGRKRRLQLPCGFGERGKRKDYEFIKTKTKLKGSLRAGGCSGCGGCGNSDTGFPGDEA